MPTIPSVPKTDFLGDIRNVREDALEIVYSTFADQVKGLVTANPFKTSFDVPVENIDNAKYIIMRLTDENIEVKLVTTGMMSTGHHINIKLPIDFNVELPKQEEEEEKEKEKEKEKE